MTSAWECHFSHKLSLALLEGWWKYEDEVLRIPGCPGLYPETWSRVLESEGFVSVLFPAEAAQETQAANSYC